jgi:hypothetical protein
MNTRPRRVAITPQLIVSGATAAAVVALALFAAVGTLNTRDFATGCLAVMAMSATVWFLLLKRRTAEDTDGGAPYSRAHKSIGKRYLLVAGLLIWLVLSFLVTRGGPWAPRLVGASVVLLVLLAVLVRKPR